VIPVQYQAAAKADLVEVWVQIANDSIEKADEYISRLQETCELIADQPAMGVARPDIADGVRSFPVDNYIIYYEVHARTLSVLRVWHAARDPLTLSVDP
jgi:plasmid stabilization system protein ParE